MTASLRHQTARRASAATLVVLVTAALLAAACASGRAFSRGMSAAEAGDWDAAVAYYTRAANSAPNNPEYKIALQRALENAALAHLEKGRVLEARGQFEEALREYRKAADYDPLNGELAAKVEQVNRAIAERIEAARPKPRVEQLRDQARQASPEPALNPASRQPLDITFNNTSVRAILDFIGKTTGINITYDRDTLRQVDTGNYSVELHGVTLEQALNQIMVANTLFYKVLDPHTILVVTDSLVKRQAYEEQVIQVFYISHANADELMTVLNQVIRVPGSSNQPTMQFNKTANTITIRASAAVAKICEQVIRANDKPRAELVIDVEVLEVNRTRAKQYGLDLNDYSANLVFSPEVVPGTTTSNSGTGTGTGTGTTTTAATGVTHTNLFNLNSLRGLNKGDFYLSIPAAVLRLLETDSDTKLVAKPQLRGSEGEKLTLNLGSQIPVPSTTFGAVGAGGLNTIPVSSFTLKDVGLNFAIQPRVTFENDVILTLELENSTFLGNIQTAGQNLPSFGQRKVSTRLRLRDGETNLLAGLLQTNDSKTVTGFPGLVRLPFFKQVFSSNNNQFNQTDIVMLLTPHIIRSHDLTQADVSPIYIGTATNLGLSGPPPLIAPPPGSGGGDQGAAPQGAVQPNPFAPVAGVPPAAAAGTPPAGVVQPGAPGAAPGQPPTPPGAQPPQGGVNPPAGVTPPQPGGAVPPPQPGAAVAPTQPGAVAPPQPGAATKAPAQAAPAFSPGGGPLVAINVSSPDFRVGGGPYTVPLMISGANAISTLSLTVRYNPAVLKVRGVQDGTFMRQGGLNSGFVQQVDPTSGRVDITFTRAGDATGASGGGPLAVILFDPVAAGSATLAVSGVAAGPSGAAIPLQFAPATIVVK